MIGINKADSHVTEDTDVQFRVIVMVYNRNASLQRLLDSLNGVDYMGAKVVVDIWIDRSKKTGEIHSPTYITAKNFKFQHGIAEVHNHTKHAGVYGQWMDTWHPTDNTSEIVVFLEDDITVSKYLYKWLVNVHRKYDKRTDLAGYSLQGISIKHGGGGGNLHAPEKEVCFLYPVLGSWGFSPKKENWMKYIEWYKKASLDKTFHPYVEIPGFLPTVWYKIWMKQGKTDGMWTMWHIFYTFSQKQLILYPNLPGYKGLTVNWKEAGLHYSNAQKEKKPAPVMTEWDSRYDSLPDEPIQLDIKGRIQKQFS